MNRSAMRKYFLQVLTKNDESCSVLNPLGLVQFMLLLARGLFCNLDDMYQLKTFLRVTNVTLTTKLCPFVSFYFYISLRPQIGYSIP